jgi:hypothetical protein
MILAALNDYYARLLDDPDSGISPPGYSLEKISYAIVLDRSGKVVAVDDIQDTSGKKPFPKSLSPLLPVGQDQLRIGCERQQQTQRDRTRCLQSIARASPRRNKR